MKKLLLIVLFAAIVSMSAILHWQKAKQNSPDNSQTANNIQDSATQRAEPVETAETKERPQYTILEKGKEVLFSGKPLALGSTACPCAVDWNEDGVMDLVAGTFKGGGTVYVFANKGTNDKPLFEDGEILTAKGQPIRVSGW